MSDWEFLLQKEGDRSWLPLESTDVEILEGRYRIVARSQFTEGEVQIRVLHESPEEDPPVRRVNTRNGRTNKEGLIALVPYTNFKPGLWEISCEPRGVSGILPEANPQTINLQVLPCESDPLDFSQSGAEEEETAETGLVPEEKFVQIPDEAKQRLPKVENQKVSIPKEIPAKPLIKPLQKTDRPPEPIVAEQPPEVEESYMEKETTEPVVAEQPPEVENNYIEETTEPVVAEPSPEIKNNYIEEENPVETSVAPPKWELILERDSYIAKLGEIFILSGTVSAESEGEIPPLVGGSLQICLRNPETSEILAEIEEPLPEQTPPIIFGCTIAVPEKVKTRLVLGQIALADSTGTIASQSFTITAPLEQWLEALDRNFSEEEHQALPPEATRKPQKVDFPSFLNVGGAMPSATPEPQGEGKGARPSDWTEVSSPELPAFGNSMAEAVSAEGVNLVELLARQRQSVESTEPTEDVEEETEVDSLAEDIWGSPETAEEESELSAAEESVAPPPAPLEKGGAGERRERQESQSDRSPTTGAFQGLKKQDRFLSRLNSLVGDSELLEWMKTDPAELPAETEEAETDTAAAGFQVDETASNEPEGEIDWEAREVVVDDEPLPPVPGTGGVTTGWILPGVAGSDRSSEEGSTSGYVLPPDEPVPTPVVEILDGEVVAGRRVRVRVQLPDLLARVYVKLWISDRQTQTIADHPRWVTDFSLNGFDKLEAIVELKVPYGCMAVRFEAIAREMQTNRESHKTSIDRDVLPPPPPSLPLEGSE
jgi:hypothetical protein